MAHRANKFFAKKMAGGTEPEWPALCTVAGSPDGYHSAKETSDFDDDIKEEERADQEVILRTVQLARQDKKFRNLRTEDWHQAQLMDLVIPHVLDWLRLSRNNQVKLNDFLRGKASEAN